MNAIRKVLDFLYLLAGILAALCLIAPLTAFGLKTMSSAETKVIAAKT